jgi:hypothetical protein
VSAPNSSAIPSVPAGDGTNGAGIAVAGGFGSATVGIATSTARSKGGVAGDDGIVDASVTAT